MKLGGPGARCFCRLTEKRALLLLRLPMKKRDPRVLRALGKDWACLLGDGKPVNTQHQTDFTGLQARCHNIKIKYKPV